MLQNNLSVFNKAPTLTPKLECNTRVRKKNFFGLLTWKTKYEETSLMRNKHSCTAILSYCLFAQIVHWLFYLYKRLTVNKPVITIKVNSPSQKQLNLSLNIASQYGIYAKNYTRILLFTNDNNEQY